MLVSYITRICIYVCMYDIKIEEKNKWSVHNTRVPGMRRSPCRPRVKSSSRCSLPTHSHTHPYKESSCPPLMGTGSPFPSPLIYIHIYILRARVRHIAAAATFYKPAPRQPPPRTLLSVLSPLFSLQSTLSAIIMHTHP